MSVLKSDIKFYGSQGGNLGGLPDLQNEIIFGVSDNFLTRITGQQALSGLVDHHCLYVVNNSVADALNEVHTYLQTISLGSTMHIELGISSLAASIPELQQQYPTDIPNGVTFSRAIDADSALDLGTLGAGGGYRGIWVKRTIEPNTPANFHALIRLLVVGDTV